MDINKLISDFDNAHKRKKDAEEAAENARRNSETRNNEDAIRWLKDVVRPILQTACTQILASGYDASVTESTAADRGSSQGNIERSVKLSIATRKSAKASDYGHGFTVVVTDLSDKASFISVVQDVRESPGRGEPRTISAISEADVREALNRFLKLAFTLR